MTFWLVAGAMTAAVVALLLIPLFRPREVARGRGSYNAEVYRAQLEEIERDRERGLVGEREAAAARLEVERRLLAAATDDNQAARARPGTRRAAALGVVVGLPLLAAAVYAELGNPGLPGAPYAARADQQGTGTAAGLQQEGGSRVPPVATMLAQLEQRVEDNPDDLDGWLRLGRAYFMVERPEDAAAAYRRAIALRDDMAPLHSALGEALVTASGGLVTGPAREAFARALELDPSDPGARFFTGLGELQRGEQRAALDTWVGLVADSPAGAPWLPDLRRRVAALGAELGVDVSATLAASAAAAPPAAVTASPGTGAAPSPADLAAMAATEDGRRRLQDEAEGLAARLDREPKDYQGWIRLAQLRGALGEPERAREALQRGSAAYPGAPFVQQQFQAAAAELGLGAAGDGPATAGAGRRGPTADQVAAAQAMSPEDQQAMINGMVEGLAQRLEREPDDAEGWRMLGRSYRVLGRPEEAAQAFERAASLLPDDPAAQLDHARALAALAEQGAPVQDEITSTMRRVLELDGDNPEALFYLGHAARAEGDAAGAERHWRRLLDQLPPDSPEHAQVQELLDSLPAGG